MLSVTDLILALVVGTLFWSADTDSIIGVLFQSMFINVLGKFPLQLDDNVVHGISHACHIRKVPCF